METFGMKIKRILQNKDTVTFIGIVLLVIVLYISYSMRVKSQIKTVTVPFASTDIMAGSRITQDMVSFRDVPAGMIGRGVLTNEADIVDRYASGLSVIPAGSLFYEQAVVSEEQATILEELSYPDGFTKYSAQVTTESTYGNSILPGNYVDIWFVVQPNLKDSKLLIGKLISNVKIISVKDSNGYDVFQNLDEESVPAILNFALPDDCFNILKAAYLVDGSYEPEIKFVPTNESLEEEPGDTFIASDLLKEWIYNHVEYIES